MRSWYHSVHNHKTLIHLLIVLELCQKTEKNFSMLLSEWKCAMLVKYTWDFDYSWNKHLGLILRKKENTKKEANKKLI